MEERRTMCPLVSQRIALEDFTLKKYYTPSKKTHRRR
jgi:hypothetical protein